MADPVSLGGVDESEIAATAAVVGVPGDAGSSLITKFIRRVAGLVATRQTRGETGQYAVFLQSEAVTEHLKKCKYVEVPTLVNGIEPVSDRVFLSSPNLMSSFRLCLNWTDDASLFAAIRTAGLGGVPALVVDFRSGVPIGLFYKLGLDDTSSGEEIALDELPITPEQLKKVLDRFYAASLRTPLLIRDANAAKVWNDSSKGIPESRPEEIIQGRLADALRSAFPNHESRGEQETEEGRADIVISKKTLSKNNEPALVSEWVLELKALADMTSTGKPSTTDIPGAVRKGLEQAISYKALNGSLKAAVCCYDMRKADEGDTACFTHVATDAATHGVPLWRWYLFRSAGAARTSHGYLTAATT